MEGHISLWALMKLHVYRETVSHFKVKNFSVLRVISHFPREADENCALLGYYAASSGNSLPTFRENLKVPS
jgi:hypothetical protein